MKKPPRIYLLLITIISVTTAIKLLLGYKYFGFHSGDDVEILSAAFNKVFGLEYRPWEIRNLFISHWLIAPALEIAKAFGVKSTDAFIWVATFPLVVLSSLNIFLVYYLAHNWMSDRIGAVIAACLFAFHWLPLGYGSTVYPRTAATTCILLAAILSVRPQIFWRLLAAGSLISIAFALRYSEALFALPLLGMIVSRHVTATKILIRVGVLLTGFVAGSLLTVGLVDWLSYGKPFASLIAFANFTLLDKHSSSLRGNQPWFWYFSRLPQWLPLTLIPFLWQATRIQAVRQAWWFVAVPLLILSIIHHKEQRYLQGVIPFVCILAAAGVRTMLAKGHRYSVAVLLFASLVMSLFGLRFLSRKSMAAVEAARSLSTDVVAKSVALSQSWAYGEHLYFGNRIEVIDLPVPPSPKDINRHSTRADHIGIYEKDATENPELASTLMSRGFRQVRIWRSGKSKPVIIFTKD